MWYSFDKIISKRYCWLAFVLILQALGEVWVMQPFTVFLKTLAFLRADCHQTSHIVTLLNFTPPLNILETSPQLQWPMTDVIVGAFQTEPVSRSISYNLSLRTFTLWSVICICTVLRNRIHSLHWHCYFSEVSWCQSRSTGPGPMM